MSDHGNAESHPPETAPKATPTTPARKQDGVEQRDFINPTINIIQSASRKTSYSSLSSISREGTPPPLPPRPKNPNFLGSRPSTAHSTAPARPQLVSKATTQLSYNNTQTYNQEGKDDPPSSGASRARGFFGLNTSRNVSDVEEAASVKSFAPTDIGVETESILGEVAGDYEKPLLKALGRRFQDQESESMFPPDAEFEAAFRQEFDDVEEMKADGSNEGQSVLLYLERELRTNEVLNRNGYGSMAREIETLLHLLLRSETHL